MQVFGNWALLWPYKSAYRRGRVVCLCRCGTIRDVRKGHLVGGKSKSCGCSGAAKPAWIMSGRTAVLTAYGNEVMNKYGRLWKNRGYNDKGFD